MAKDKSDSNEEVKVDESRTSKTTKTYYFTRHSFNVEASSREEAEKALAEHLKDTKKEETK